jgi:hypothetical protein
MVNTGLLSPGEEARAPRFTVIFGRSILLLPGEIHESDPPTRESRA